MCFEKYYLAIHVPESLLYVSYLEVYAKYKFMRFGEKLKGQMDYLLIQPIEMNNYIKGDFKNIL